MSSPSSSRLPWLLVLAAALLLATYIVRPSQQINGNSPAVGHPAPSLSLVGLHLHDQDQQPGDACAACVPESPQWSGRVTIVHFWGTWCGPCRHELPSLAEVYRQLREHPEFQFYAVSCAAFDDPSLPTLVERTRRFYRSVDIELPTYADPTTDFRRELLCLMEQDQMAYPTTVLVDRQGTIQATWIGIPPGGAETIESRVQQLLAQNP